VARVCLRCRFLLADDEPCDEGHPVVSLDDSADRARLRTAVWGDAAPSNGDGTLRSALRFTVAMTGVIAATLAALTLLFTAGASRVSMWSPGPWIVIAAVTLPLAIAIGWEIFGGDGVRLWPPHRVRLPVGATLAVDGPVAAHGPVRGTATIAPLSGRRCVAWAVTLEYEGRVVLRAGHGSGLTIASNDGEIEIPAGRLAIATRRRRIRHGRAKRWLPDGARGELAPFTRAWESTLVEGDVVELLGEVEQVAVGGYRDPAAWRAIAPVTLRCG
jgi:hypothetical protein